MFALALSLLLTAQAAPLVDTSYPYVGPVIPVGDWVDPTVNGNGKGFPRLIEPPAVAPCYANPTNSINVIQLAYTPGGMIIHFQTPFGIGGEPCVNWGTDPSNLSTNTKGFTTTYDRTPPCSLSAVTQCSQFFHSVTLDCLTPDTTYYYQIPGGNGTSESDVLSFTTAQPIGNNQEFSVAVINDMGYTNAQGTHTQLLNQISKEDVAFAWHGGDLSYADDWYSGILPCEDDWPVCYDGTSTRLLGNISIPAEYLVPLPAEEIANQGGPQGGDMSVIYESNWDLWQQWMSNITSKVPYMTTPGNHEATCAEFDGPNNELSAYLNLNQPNSTLPNSTLTYYSCPPSQRNYTAYQHRFSMPGEAVGGKGNFWYSFDYGLAHFISFNGETDFYQSPESPFISELEANQTSLLANQTYITNSGPFGYINNSNWKDNKAYEQYQWLAKDLAGVDRSKTPWVFAMSHRPMYSSQISSYQLHMRNAFEDLFLEYGVDAYLAGHIHWYERMYPMGKNGTLEKSNALDQHTYQTANGSMIHLVNGQAGNVESHSTIDPSKILNITAVLDQVHYGFSKLTVVNETVAKWEFIKGMDGSVGDYLTIIKS